MIRNSAAAIGLLIAATSFGEAETLRVSVVNEQNSGVKSFIFVHRGTEQVVFGQTDEKGIFEQAHKCEAAHHVSALAMDKGSFFSSQLTPCKQSVIVKLLSRKAPKTLYGHGLEQILLPDGSPGLVVYVSFLKTDKVGLKGASSCDVKVRGVFNQQVFKVNTDGLVLLAAGQTAAGDVLTDTAGPYQETATFPFDCDSATGRIQTLEMTAAGRIDQALKAPGLLTDKTLKILDVK